MSETIITVSGSADRHHSPERATVRLSLDLEGPDRQATFDAVRRMHAEVSEELRRLHDPISDAVTRWSAEQVSIWGQRPWNQDGVQLPPVYHASAAVNARFRDFSAMASWLDSAAFRDGVTVASIDWSLTTATRSSLEAETQTDAILSARAKALNYATALGLGSLRVIAVADPGMLGDGGGGAPPAAAAARFASHEMAKSGVGGAIDLTPADVVIRSSVDARFGATA
jgi:uncharacterized protein YggE